MKFIRKVNLSLYYYLKYVVLAEYIEESEDYLEYDTPTGLYLPQYDYEPNASDKGRGVYPFDTVSSGVFNECFEATYINVYHSQDDVDIIPSTDYSVNYKTPGIKLLGGSNIPTRFAYKSHYVSVCSYWLFDLVPTIPLVVIDWKGFDFKGFQLGGGRKHLCDIDVHIYASSRPELDDLTYTVHDGLYNKCTHMFGFTGGDILNYDGTFNIDFDCSYDTEIQMLYFDDVNSEYLKLPLESKSDINTHRSKIELSLVAYKEAG